MANVSVANRHLMRLSWNKISITSFTIGSRPPWWMPTPRCSSGSMLCTCGSLRSSSLSCSIAFVYTDSTNFFSCTQQRVYACVSAPPPPLTHAHTVAATPRAPPGT